MSLNIFYHNFDKNIINETCLIDFMDNSNIEDSMYKSEAGNALLIELTDKDIRDMKSEYDQYYADEE